MFSITYKIPEDVKVEVHGREVVVTGEGGKENRRVFKAKHVEIKKDNGTLTVFTTSRKKRDRADVGTVMGHIRNMIKGIEKGSTYRLKVVYSHFPMNVKVEGNILSVENFLGEKKPRTMRILEGVEIRIEGQDIYLSGIDKEQVGLCASQIEQLCRVSGLDRRIFQDGIYIVEKDGKPLK